MLKQSGTVIHVDRVYETDMAEGLKGMALEGHGLAFLPQSAVTKELQSGALVRAFLPHEPPMVLTMEVRAYREKPRHQPTAGGRAQDLWAYWVRTAAESGPDRGHAT